MEYDKNICPVVGVEGFVSAGKQFDVDIHLPEDNRSVIYGVVKDCYDEPIKDAVVKLIEVDKDGKRDGRKPVTHTFTDKAGQFVFGPLCANKFYEIEIWANEVKHSKICTTCKYHGKCLKGEKLDCECKEYFDKHEDEKYESTDYSDKHDDKKCESKDYSDKHDDKKCECKEYSDKYEDKKCK